MNFKDKNDVVKNYNFKLKIFTTPIKIFSVDPDSDDPDGSLDLPSKINKKIDVKKCQFSTANTKLRVSNINEKVSQWFYSKLNSTTDNIYNKKCQLIIEIDGIETILFTGYFRNFDNDVYETYYDFEIANLKEKLKESIFDGQLSETAIFDTRTLHSDFTQDNVTKDNESVKRIYFSGHPLKLAKAIFHMLFEEEFNDVVDSTAFDETELEFDNVYFEWFEALNDPGSFLEKQIYRLINRYPVITEEGKITLISQELPSSDEVNLDDITLTEEDLKNIKKNKTDLSMLLNNIRCSVNFDSYENEYNEYHYLPDEASFIKYGNELFPKTPYKLEFKGLNNFSLSDRTTLLSNITKTLYARYSDFTKLYEVEAFFSDFPKHQIGNYIVLQSEKLIDNETGLRGLVTTFGEDSEATIDSTEWGDYIGDETNDSLGYLNGYKVIEVSRTISLDLFTSIESNHSSINSFLTGCGV